MTIKRSILWFAVLPALSFLAVSFAYIAYLLSGNGWGLIPAMWPGLPWTLAIGWTKGATDTRLLLFGSAALNAAILFAVLAVTTYGAQRLLRQHPTSN